MPPSLVSPLARRLAESHQLSLTELIGTGPRGRVMADDIRRALSAPPSAPASLPPSPSEAAGQQSSSSLGKTSVAADHLPQTRPEKDGFYVYDCQVSMSALAALSRPIAVQCDKLLDQRYSLMDYILRAVVKACTSHASAQQDALNVLLFEDRGNYICALRDVASKTLYQLTRAVQSGSETLEGFHPHIVVCDALTTREQVGQYLELKQRPLFGFISRGGSQKVGIRVGCDVKSMELDYTFYVSNQIPANQADGVAARLRNLLHDPVSLLLIA